MKYTSKNVGQSIKNEFEAVRWNQTRRPVYQSVQDINKENNQYSRVELMRLARNFALNSPTASDLLRTTVESSADVDFYPATSDSAFNAAAREYWLEWCEKPGLKTNDSLSIYKRWTARARLVDGDVFILKIINDGKPKITILDAHNVKTPPEMRDKEGITIFDGIEIDSKTERPKKIWYEIEKDVYDYIKEFEFVHEANKVNANQYRGFSHFASVLPVMIDWKEMNDGEVMAIKDSQMITRIFKTKDGELDTNIVTNSGDLFIKGSSANLIGKQQPVRKKANVPHSIAISTDEDVELVHSQRPSDQVQHFWDTKLSETCVGFGIPREIIYSERNTGATQRAIFEKFNLFIKSQAKISEEVWYEIYLFVLSWGIKHDENAPNALKNPPRDWRKVTTSYPKPLGIDATRQSGAILNEMYAGVRSIHSVIEELGQGDFTTLIRKNAEAVITIKRIVKDFNEDKQNIKDGILISESDVLQKVLFNPDNINNSNVKN